MLVLLGAFAIASVTLFATTFGDCTFEITLAACEQGKADALRTGMPMALILYAGAVCAIWRWPLP